MKIRMALAQINILPGQPKENAEKMLDFLQQAKKQAADVVVFPELAIPGYLVGDLWEYEYFLRECEKYGQKIIGQSTDICVIFGNIAVDWKKHGEDGRVRKYNACFVAQNGKLVQSNLPYPFYVKTALPNYRQFEDSRHFFGNTALAYELGKQPEQLIQPFKVKINGEEIALGCMICEDGWTDFYPVNPPKILAEKAVDIFINISSSPYYLGKNNLRHKIFSNLSKQTDTALIYLNHTGVQNNGKNIYSYDGASCLYDKQGQLCASCPNFEEQLLLFSFNKGSYQFQPKYKQPNSENETEQLYTSLKYSLESFLQQNKIEKITIGLSGGIDSAVSAAFFTHILGPQNVLLINMPGEHNSQTTIGLASELAKNLGANYATIPIEESVELTNKQISSILIGRKKLTLSDFALENVQARDRSSRILSATAAAFGGIFSCNANKSEITIGYGTFYGDLAGAIAPLGDLWKHQVYALGHYLNEKVFAKKVIPQGIFDIMPSAELSPSQTVGTGGDPLYYPYHDYLFKAFVEDKLSPVEISLAFQKGALEEKLGCEKGLVKKLFTNNEDFFADLEKWWLSLNGLAVAKRIQSPPIIAVSAKAFGFERRETQIPTALPEEYIAIKNQILKGFLP